MYGIRSRLRARSGSVLTCHRQVIHYRPVRIPTIKKPSHTRGMTRPLWRRERDSNPCEIALKRFSRPPRYDHFDIPPYKRNYEIVLEKTLEEKLCCPKSARVSRKHGAFSPIASVMARRFQDRFVMTASIPLHAIPLHFVGLKTSPTTL